MRQACGGCTALQGSSGSERGFGMFESFACWQPWWCVASGRALVVLDLYLARTHWDFCASVPSCAGFAELCLFEKRCCCCLTGKMID